MSIRVLVVDDSAMARRVLQQELSKDADIRVIGTAKDPLDASEKIEALDPDVMTLDLELPRMDGLTFLRSLMRHHPMPVVIVSAYTTKGSRLAMEALEAGAVEIVPKPGEGFALAEMAAELLAKVKGASQARVGRGGNGVGPPPARTATAEARPAGVRPGAGAGGRARAALRDQTVPEVLPPLNRTFPAERVIAIGSSTGGTQALQHILSRLPADMPPILVAQHMPPGFTSAFAKRLDQLCELEVKEAEHNDNVVPGRVYIAPGAHHMALRRTASRYWIEISDGPRVFRQRPSVEVLFQSVARVAGGAAIGAMLTGMGGDGAPGLLAMRQAGAETIAQDEASCVVFGMPKEAIKAGGVEHIAHLHDIAALIHKLV